MKRVLTTLCLLGAFALAAGPAGAHETGFDRDRVHDRFERMDRMMEGRGQATGPARREMMHEHMEQMNAQMQAMHGMMAGHGGMMMGSGRMGSGQMGSGQMGQGRMGPGGDPDARFEAMQERMDFMQRMMEQMLEQQEMMLEEEAE